MIVIYFFNVGFEMLICKKTKKNKQTSVVMAVSWKINGKYYNCFKMQY